MSRAPLQAYKIDIGEGWAEILGIRSLRSTRLPLRLLSGGKDVYQFNRGGRLSMP